jgi:hypothetical protein
LSPGDKWLVSSAYKKSVTMVSDTSSPKMNLQKIAQVKQIIAAWGLTGLKKKRRKMGWGRGGGVCANL